MLVYEDKIELTANSIKNGNLVIFPTETVYGIGANALDENAVKKIFSAKTRSTDNPLIVHISDINMLDIVAKDISISERKLITTFWPGPLTIILKKSDNIPYLVTSNLETVGIRMPSNTIARKLIKAANVPIAAPSANVSGRPSGTIVSDIYSELNDKVDYIIDGGKCKLGIESTVVKVIDNKVCILRPGIITKEDIENKCNLQSYYDKHIFEIVNKDENVISPGIKYKHYAPKTNCILATCDDNTDIYIKILNYIKNNKLGEINIICCNENEDKYSKIANTLCYGSKNNLNAISSNIFTLLRKADLNSADLLIIEGVKKEGIGVAIMNRLIRAAGYNII